MLLFLMVINLNQPRIAISMKCRIMNYVWLSQIAICALLTLDVDGAELTSDASLEPKNMPHVLTVVLMAGSLEREHALIKLRQESSRISLLR